MPLGGQRNGNAVRADVALRRTKAIRMNREGYAWDEIATELGYASRGAAFTDVERAYKQYLAEMFTEADLYRVESLEQLRELIKALWPRREDEKVAAEIRRITERRDKLTGAERPIRIEIGESDVDRALRELDAQIDRRAREAEGETVPPA